jgi:hypothetical protein
METIIIETKIEITKEAIESMLVTAIEGGVDYWCCISLKDKREKSHCCLVKMKKIINQ